MFEKPSIFKVPTIKGNSYSLEACTTYSPACSNNFTNSCVDGYSYTPTPAPGPTPGDVISAGIGTALSVVGSVASVVALT